MAVFNLRDFSGTVPRKHPKYLGDSQAQTANDCDLYSHALRPISGLTLRNTVTRAYAAAPMSALYLYDNRNFFTFWDINSVNPEIEDDHVKYYV